MGRGSSASARTRLLQTAQAYRSNQVMGFFTTKSALTIEYCAGFQFAFKQEFEGFNDIQAQVFTDKAPGLSSCSRVAMITAAANAARLAILKVIAGPSVFQL